MFRVTVFATLLVTMSAYGATIQVPWNQPTIEHGLDAASDGDTVLVGPGTYSGIFNQRLSFDGKAVTLRSKRGPLLTIIDGGGAGRGFVFAAGDTSARVEGLTVRNCHAVYDDVSGGAIHCSAGASPRFEDCIIQDCSAAYGGAIYSNGASPSFEGCVIERCRASTDGGGVYLVNSNAEFTDCRIVECVADRHGGAGRTTGGLNTFWGCLVSGNGAGDVGGAFYVSGSSILLESSWMMYNDAGGRGGAAYFDGGGVSVVRACEIRGNQAGSDGGGVYVISSSDPNFTNVLIADNSSDGVGGGISLRDDGVNPTFKYCTIANNSASGGGGGVDVTVWSDWGNHRYATGHFYGSILWDNAPDEIRLGTHGESYNAHPGAQLEYTDIRGGWSGYGNIDLDPLFVLSDSTDYRIDPAYSPCLDGGIEGESDGCRPPGHGREIADMGAYGGPENCGMIELCDLEVTLNAPDTVRAGEEVTLDVTATNPCGVAEALSLVKLEFVGPDNGVYIFSLYAPARPSNLPSGGEESRDLRLVVPAWAARGAYQAQASVWLDDQVLARQLKQIEVVE